MKSARETDRNTNDGKMLRMILAKVTYPCRVRSLILVTKEMQFIVPLAQSRDINVIQPLQCCCWIKLVWFQHLNKNLEPIQRQYMTLRLHTFLEVDK